MLGFDQADTGGQGVAGTNTTYDQIVIGAGIAGASVAAELAANARVLVLERESHPAYHTTGRSAAQFTTAYGPPVIRALTRASEAFFRTPDSAFVTHDLLRDRGVVFIARADQGQAMDRMAEALKDAVVPLDTQAACRMLPILRPEYVARAMIDVSAADIDVDALHQHYLKTFAAAGGELWLNAAVEGLERSGGMWHVQTPTGTVRAPVLVNAAGAWADEIATLAGAARAMLTPKRRTALLVSPPDGMAPDGWPMVVDVDEQFYLKPDAGKLLISPADATPSQPCDAQPEELDVAVCVDRIETAFDLTIRRIDHKWAGLRSFLPDGNPMACFDPGVDGFFWLAGQGGYGIQSAPALARAAAALINKNVIPSDICDQGVSAQALSGARKGLAA